MAAFETLGDDALAWFARSGKKEAPVEIGALFAGHGGCGAEEGGLRLIALGAPIERRRHGRPLRRRQQWALGGLGVECLKSVPGRDCEHSAQLADCRAEVAGPLDPTAHPVALADRLRHHVLEGLVGGLRDRGRERAAERSFRRLRRVEQHAQAGAVEQLRFRGLVEHGEARRHIGLERELVQELRAEGMDGLHLEPARRLERKSEQAPRQRAQIGIGPAVRDFSDRSIERGIVERGPLPQLLEHPVGHVGGGRLGEGDAENLCGIDAVEQKPDHALGEHVGLARAGIGRHPGGDRRVRSCDLHTDEIVRNGAGTLVHGAPPMSSSSRPIDHSFTRARWS